MAHGNHGDAASHHQHHSTLGTATHATLHCMVGCAIGEIAGVVLGAALGFGVWARMSLGTALAFVIGLQLAALPLIKRANMHFVQAMKTIFWGAVASIAAMEIAMNGADHWFGDAVAALDDRRFWLGFLVMIPAGFIAALPVNYLLIRYAVKTTATIEAENTR